MQWTPDRNAGFSTADPGKLYLPVIQSLVYHHNHTNVEAQMASGSSLLHWVRGMLSVRREHPVFGLGDFTVCESTHERVLAFTRVDRHARDTEDRSAVAVLCVNNLSSRPQSTTLTLPEELWDWETRDLFGGSGFPDIAPDGTITITLGSRDFFWLALQPRTRRRPWLRSSRRRRSRPTKLELVAEWMGDQRWYAAKGRTPRLRLLTAWRLDDPEGEVGVETLVVADEAGAETVVYQVPLTYRGEPLGSADHALVGTMEHSALGRRWVYDAPHDPVYAAQLLELVQGRVRAQSSKVSDAVEESVSGVPQPSWRHEVHVRTSRVLSGEQSNTSVILDCDLPDGHHTPLIVKVFRMLSPGDNPDVVLQGALVDAGSRRVPAVVGAVTGRWPHPGADGDVPASGHLAFAQEFLPGVEDAWRVALHAAEAGTDFAGPARALGEATAEVHRTLADVLGTEPTTRDQAGAIVAEMRLAVRGRGR